MFLVFVCFEDAVERGQLYGMKSKHTHVIALVQFTAEGILHYTQLAATREVAFFVRIREYGCKGIAICSRRLSIARWLKIRCESAYPVAI